MNKLRRFREPVLFLTRVALGCVFLASSLPKLRQPYDFLSDVYQYELTGPGMTKFIAMTLPWLELLVGICLLGAIVLGGALLISMFLTLIFAFAQSSALIRELPIACGCFGSVAATETIGYASLLRVGLMFVAALVGFLAWKAIPVPVREEEVHDAAALPEPA